MGAARSWRAPRVACVGLVATLETKSSGWPTTSIETACTSPAPHEARSRSGSISLRSFRAAWSWLRSMPGRAPCNGPQDSLPTAAATSGRSSRIGGSFRGTRQSGMTSAVSGRQPRRDGFGDRNGRRRHAPAALRISKTRGSVGCSGSARGCSGRARRNPTRPRRPNRNTRDRRVRAGPRSAMSRSVLRSRSIAPGVR